jgi:transaldolase
MRPKELHTKIFLDGGDPEETKKAIELLGFLDGQTTNPTLISKNPDALARIQKKDLFSKEEVYDFYKGVVLELSGLLPDGSISVEVYADSSTTKDEMYKQAKEMFSWIPNAHIKLPITQQGLSVAERITKEGMRVNMTLCFSQEQAAAVSSATKGAKRGDVFVSPFIGRLDDRGENGMDLIANIIKMYKIADSHVEVLTASVRSMEHFFEALKIRTDIITVPFKVVEQWVGQRMQVPNENFVYDASGFKPIPYQEFDLESKWQDFDIKHELTDKGIEKFSEDWNTLVQK